MSLIFALYNLLHIWKLLTLAGKQSSWPAARYQCFVKRASTCVYGKEPDLMPMAFTKGLDFIYGQGIITEKILSISLAVCILEIFPNQQCFSYSKDFKGYLFLLEMAPLVSLCFPWANVFQVFKWAHRVDLAHSSSKKSSPITFLFLLNFLVSCTNTEKRKHKPKFYSGLELPVCFYRILFPNKATNKTPVLGQMPQS